MSATPNERVAVRVFRLSRIRGGRWSYATKDEQASLRPKLRAPRLRRARPSGTRRRSRGPRQILLPRPDRLARGAGFGASMASSANPGRGDGSPGTGRIFGPSTRTAARWVVGVLHWRQHATVLASPGVADEFASGSSCSRAPHRHFEPGARNSVRTVPPPRAQPHQRPYSAVLDSRSASRRLVTIGRGCDRTLPKRERGGSMVAGSQGPAARLRRGSSARRHRLAQRVNFGGGTYVLTPSSRGDEGFEVDWPSLRRQTSPSARLLTARAKALIRAHRHLLRPHAAGAD